MFEIQFSTKINSQANLISHWNVYLYHIQRQEIGVIHSS